MPYSKEQSQRFFTELEAASRASRRVATGSAAISFWGDPTWPQGAPSGVVLHYTAGGSCQGSVDWLTNPVYNAKASCHIVVARGREEWADAAVPPGGLVDALPSSVIQLRPPNTTAWASTWANNLTVSIELSCWGELRRAGKGFVTPDNAWTNPYKGKELPIEAGGRLWQPYTQEQVATAVQLIHYYQGLFGAFCPAAIVGHEQVQGINTAERPMCDKRDAGVFFNWQSFRDAVAGRIPLSSLDMRPPSVSVEKNADLDKTPPFAVASGSQASMEALASDQFRALGYAIEMPKTSRYFDGRSVINQRSLTIFQKMMALTVDGQLGPVTAKALSWRVRDRWINERLASDA